MRFTDFNERLAYEDKVVIEAVNEQLGIKLTHYRTYGDDIFCLDEKNRSVVITGSRWAGKNNTRRFVVRGVLRRKRKDRRWTFLINGQPGTNCVPVKGSGQGEHWLSVPLGPNVIPFKGDGFSEVTIDEIEAVVEDYNNLQSGPKGTYFGSIIRLTSGEVSHYPSPYSFWRDVHHLV